MSHFVGIFLFAITCTAAAIFISSFTNAQTTTTTSTPYDWSSCSTAAIAVPANPHGVGSDACAKCAPPTLYEFYPCDSSVDVPLCYCEGSPIPEGGLTAFSFCSEAVPIPGNPHNVDDCSMCSNTSLAFTRHYPCDNPGVLCECSPGHGYVRKTPDTTTQAPAAPPTSSPPPTSPPPSSSSPPAAVSSSPPPPAATGPFTHCTRAIATPGNPHGVTDTQCGACSNGAQSWYPCDQPYTLCSCEEGKGYIIGPAPAPTTTQAPPTPPPTSAPSTSAPPTPAPPRSTKPAVIGDTIDDFRRIDAPLCNFAAAEGTSANQCGKSYHGALCLAAGRFYMAQQGGTPANGIEWRGACYPADGADSWSGNLSLGSFDAGDYIKAAVPAAFTLAALSWGVIEFPAAFKVDFEMQDAIRYNLRTLVFHFFESWRSSSKTLVAAVADPIADHASWLSCKRRSDRTGRARRVETVSPSCTGTEVTADVAAGLAAAALALKRLDPTSSTALWRKAARTAADIFALAYNYPNQDYTNCVSFARGIYDSWSGYADELSFAATWLAQAQNEGLLSGTSFSGFDYLGVAKSWLPDAEADFSWDNKVLGAKMRLAQLTGSTFYIEKAKKRLLYYLNSAKRTPAGRLDLQEWAPNRHAASAAFLAKLFVEQFPSSLPHVQKKQLDDMAKRQLDYLLGGIICSVESLRDGLHDSLRDGSFESLRDCSVESLRDGLHESLRDGSVESLRDGLHESLRDGSVESLRDGLHESLRDGSVESLRDGLHDSLRDGSFESLRDGLHESLRDCSVESLRDCSVESLRDGLHDSLRDGSFESLRDGLHESLRDGSVESLRDDRTSPRGHLRGEM